MNYTLVKQCTICKADEKIRKSIDSLLQKNVTTTVILKHHIKDFQSKELSAGIILRHKNHAFQTTTELVKTLAIPDKKQIQTIQIDPSLLKENNLMNFLLESAVQDFKYSDQVLRQADVNNSFMQKCGALNIRNSMRTTISSLIDKKKQFREQESVENPNKLLETFLLRIMFLVKDAIQEIPDEFRNKFSLKLSELIKSDPEILSIISTDP